VKRKLTVPVEVEVEVPNDMGGREITRLERQVESLERKVLRRDAAIEDLKFKLRAAERQLAELTTLRDAVMTMQRVWDSNP
jgi:phage shock protein A